MVGVKITVDLRTPCSLVVKRMRVERGLFEIPRCPLTRLSGERGECSFEGGHRTRTKSASATTAMSTFAEEERKSLLGVIALILPSLWV